MSGIPSHIGIIMDGNGRWAKKRLLPRNAGHASGVKTLKKIARAAFDLGVKHISVYAFSTENSARPKDEVDGLVELIRKNLRNMVQELIDDGVRLEFLGDLSFFPNDVIQLCNDMRKESELGKSGVFNLALNYGSKSEIVNAAKLTAEGGEFTEEAFERNLYSKDSPPLDMVIRTGGEKRLSNFMLYQAAYAELFFTDTLWPDFSEKELAQMLAEFSSRNRRFGKV